MPGAGGIRRACFCVWVGGSLSLSLSPCLWVIPLFGCVVSMERKQMENGKRLFCGSHFFLDESGKPAAPRKRATGASRSVLKLKPRRCGFHVGGRRRTAKPSDFCGRKIQPRSFLTSGRWFRAMFVGAMRKQALKGRSTRYGMEVASNHGEITHKSHGYKSPFWVVSARGEITHLPSPFSGLEPWSLSTYLRCPSAL